MVITKIEPQRRNPRRLSLFIDGDFAFGLHRDIVARAQLRAGSPITAPELERLRRQEEQALAEQQAMRLLGRRLRSEHELRTRLLQEEYSPAAVTDTLGRLKSLGYIDDERFARAFIHDRLMKRPVGRARLAHDLRRRGLGGELIAAVLAEEVTAGDEQRRAEAEGAKALRRYRKRGGDGRSRRQRLTRFLVGRGFGWDAVEAAVRRLAGEEES